MLVIAAVLLSLSIAWNPRAGFGGLSMYFSRYLLSIGLPFEQFPNPYITRELNFEFHYFFMRKFWFAYLAKALVIFPGGFGTMDELMEMLTLVQTQKLKKRVVIVIYGSEFWKDVINFDALVRHGTISAEDMELFHFADTPAAALKILQDGLTEHYLKREPAGPERRRETPEIRVRKSTRSRCRERRGRSRRPR